MFSPRPRHTHPFAVSRNRTDTAFRADRRADVLPVHNEQVIEDDPVLFWQYIPQSELRLFRRLRGDEAQAVRDAVDVRIDRHA